jgi:hypothetical protein
MALFKFISNLGLYLPFYRQKPSSTRGKPIFVIRDPKPLPTPAYANDFYAALGKMIVTWARMEQHLDVLQILVAQICAKHGLQRPVLRALESKLDSLKDSFRDCAALQFNEPQVRQLMIEIKKLGSNRHKYVHSMFKGFWEGRKKGPLMVFQYISHERGKTLSYTRAFGVSDIEGFTKRVFEIHQYLMKVVDFAIQELAKIHGIKHIIRLPDPMQSETTAKNADRWTIHI